MAGKKIKSLVLIAMFVAIISVSAYITVPFTVPFTLQLFGIFAAVGILGTLKGCAAVCVYLLLGAVGAPVFSGFTGGMSRIAGPTGGYILGFVFAAIAAGFIIGKGHGFLRLFLAFISGTLVCYIFGTLWFCILYGEKTLPAIMVSCVFPFIVPDVLKCAAAAAVAVRIRKAGVI